MWPADKQTYLLLKNGIQGRLAYLVDKKKYTTEQAHGFTVALNKIVDNRTIGQEDMTAALNSLEEIRNFYNKVKKEEGKKLFSKNETSGMLALIMAPAVGTYGEKLTWQITK